MPLLLKNQHLLTSIVATIVSPLACVISLFLACSMAVGAVSKGQPAVSVERTITTSTNAGSATMVAVGELVRLDGLLPPEAKSIRWRRIPVADIEDAWPQFAGPERMANSYLERWSGWLLPPVTGRYRFILSAQDAAELWLGSSDESGSATRVIRLDQATSATSWRNPAREQVSTTIRLEKGKAYWIEARHVRGGRSFLSGAQSLRVEPDDHLIVAWFVPNDDSPITDDANDDDKSGDSPEGIALPPPKTPATTPPPPKTNKSTKTTATLSPPSPAIIPGSCLSPADERWLPDVAARRLAQQAASALNLPLVQQKNIPANSPRMYRTGFISRTVVLKADNASLAAPADAWLGRILGGELDNDQLPIARFRPDQTGDHRFEVRAMVGKQELVQNITLHAFQPVKNPDFALGKDGLANDWSIDTQAGKPSVSWDSKGGKDTDGAVRISGDKLRVFLRQKLNLCRNTRYLITVRAKGENLRIHDNGEVRPVALAVSCSVNTHVIMNKVKTDGTFDWTEFQLDIASGTYGDFDLICGLGWGKGTASGSLTIDRCIITPHPDSTRFEGRHNVLCLINDPQVKIPGPEGIIQQLDLLDRQAEFYTDMTGYFPRQGIKQSMNYMRWTDTGGTGWSSNPVIIQGDPESRWREVGYLGGFQKHEFGHVWDNVSGSMGINYESYAEWLRLWSTEFLNTTDWRDTSTHEPKYGDAWKSSPLTSPNWSISRGAYHFYEIVGLEPWRRTIREFSQKPGTNWTERTGEKMCDVITRVGHHAGLHLWAMLSKKDRERVRAGLGSSWKDSDDKKGTPGGTIPDVPVPGTVPATVKSLSLMNAAWSNASVPDDLPIRWCLDPNGFVLRVFPVPNIPVLSGPRCPVRAPVSLFAPPKATFTYTLDGRWKTLRGSIGRHYAGAKGSIVLRIIADGKPLWRGQADVGQQVPFTVTVENAKEIVLESADGDPRSAIWGMWIDPILER